MIEPLHIAERSRLKRPFTEKQRLQLQVDTDQIQVGPEAARRIAQRIEQEHGFWDYDKRRAAA